MRYLIDLKGKRFDRLIVVGLDSRRGRRYYWTCLCDCGTIKAILGENLRSGKVKSCGCARVDANQIRAPHNLSSSSTHNSWRNMRSRCLNPNNRDYPNYGGRGISICSRWDEFTNFVLDMGLRPEGTSLDRIESEGNYCPENCRWTDAKTQANNRRLDHDSTYDN